MATTAPIVRAVQSARITAYAITSEGTGAERKYALVELIVEGEKVISRKTVDKSRWRDLAEDALRRKLRGL